MTKVSVVIPCKNEEAYIGKCLDSILQSEYPAEEIEILVCDGLSSDRTPGIVKEYAANYSSVKLLINEHTTTPHALNLGIKNSSGDIIIILGGHAEFSSRYIKTCVEILQNNPKIGCVGGVLENIYENDLSRAIAAAMSSPFGVGSVHFRIGGKDGEVDTVAFGAYKREVFKKVGLFDEELIRNQDDEFNFRVTRAGFKIWLSSRLSLKYYVRSSFKKLYRQYYQYGFWKVYVNKKHNTITTFRQLVPLFFVLFLFGGLFLSLLLPVVWKVYFAIILLYLSGAVYFASRKATNFKDIACIIFSFMILHFSYGLGYLMGLFKFILLSKKPGHADARLNR